MDNFKKKLDDLIVKKHQLESDLVAPARAAAHAMKDAGMHHTADPLMEIFLQIDANDQEIKALLLSDPQGIIKELRAMMLENRGGGFRPEGA